MKENAVVARCGCEGVVEGGLSAVGLLIDEFAADAGVVGQAGNRLLPGEGLDAEPEPLVRPEGFGRAVVGGGLLQRVGERHRLTHVCFLREKLAMLEPPVWGKQTFPKSS